MESYDVAVPAGDALEHVDLIPHLLGSETGPMIDVATNHVFTALHETLIYHLASIILPCLDVDRLLDDGVCPAPQRLSRSVLRHSLSPTPRRSPDKE